MTTDHDPTGTPDPDGCDYCGRSGCRWQNHLAARDDVAAWAREVSAQ